jgi:hypothetical protein
MEVAHIVLEYFKVLVWPLVAIIIAYVYRNIVSSVFSNSKISLQLFGVKIETTMDNLKQALVATMGGFLTDRQWMLLKEIATERTVSVKDKGYKLSMEKDLKWIRPIRNAGLIMSLPDGCYIEQAESLVLTPLGNLLMHARNRDR